MASWLTLPFPLDIFLGHISADKHESHSQDYALEIVSADFAEQESDESQRDNYKHDYEFSVAVNHYFSGSLSLVCGSVVVVSACCGAVAVTGGVAFTGAGLGFIGCGFAGGVLPPLP